MNDRSFFRSTAVATLALLGTVTLAPQSANAQWVSTKELVDTYCDNEKPEEAAFCVGYVAGALHVLMAPPQMLPTGRFCVDVENQPKLTAIAERLISLRKEQEDLEKAPAFTVIAAILERGFPCPEEVLEEIAVQPEAAPSTPSDLFGLPADE